jgi:predicted nucleotidyltransferase
MKKSNLTRVKKIIRALKAYDPERVILFGSAARGDADAHSDIDLVVIKETSERFLDRIGRVYDFVKPDFAFDALVYTPNEFAEMKARENPFIENVLKEGITIYERPKGRSRAVARTSRVRSARRTKQRR